MVRERKGQVSIFVIVGIFLVAIILVFFLINNSPPKNIQDNKINQFKSTIQECVNKVSEESIYNIGQTGGYYELPNKVNLSHVSYHFFIDRSLIPSIEKISDEMAKYVNELLPFCIKKFNNNFDISYGKIDTTVKIKEESVNFNINFPLSISYGDETVQYNNFKYSKEMRFLLIYDIAKTINDYQVEEPRSTCLSCVGDMISFYNVSIFINDFNEEDTLFTIYDPYSPVKGKPYTFFFLNKYPVNNEDDIPEML